MHIEPNILKWTIFLCAMVLYFAAYSRKATWLRWAMLIIAVFYNPLINLSMDPYGRQAANVLSAIAFLAAIVWIWRDREW